MVAIMTSPVVALFIDKIEKKPTAKQKPNIRNLDVFAENRSKLVKTDQCYKTRTNQFHRVLAKTTSFLNHG
jgi:hypothetical protein